jgi:hypothetical protein
MLQQGAGFKRAIGCQQMVQFEVMRDWMQTQVD